MAEQPPNYQKLVKILNQIFQLDQSDLDFGIYRIMNIKSHEINEFLGKDLLNNITDAFSKSKNKAEQDELEELKKEDTVIKYIDGDEATKNFCESFDDVKRYIELNQKLSNLSTNQDLENDVFSHLSNFFKRYYKDGDFVSLRRYKKDTYAIPYEGEEVKLHWANADQYYIKSSEYFRDYSFKIANKTIHFKLSEADITQNNNKATGDKERRFVYIGCELLTSHRESLIDSQAQPLDAVITRGHVPLSKKDNELHINFDYKAVDRGSKQDELNKQAINIILENIKDENFKTALNTLSPTEKNKNRTLLEKHLKSYTSKNSFDYFIHKDLQGFLNRELDFYIKNEMLFIDDIINSNPIKYDEVMGKIKIFKEVAQKIINFLSQLENLQKRLWEKKKFIIETNYCLTLDKIDEKYYKEIFANQEQLKEWQNLFDVEIKNLANLKEQQYQYLVLDTKFFDIKFKYKLLNEFENLDDSIDGVLIKSENFGALNLLQHRYQNQIKTIYIDPPYNTGSDGFLYNDSYQHSSWLSFMFDRLALGRELMSDDGNTFTSMDDSEIEKLKILKHSIFGVDNFLGQWNWFKSATPPNLSLKIKKNIEYVLGYEKQKDSKKYKGVQKNSSSDDPFTKPQNTIKKLNFPANSINCKIKDTTIKSGIYGTTKYPNTLLNDMIIKNGKNFNGATFENKFIWTQNKLNEELDNFTTINCSKSIVLSYKKNSYDLEVPPNFIDKGVGVSTTEQAGKNLINMFGEEVFKYPKSVSLIKYLIQYKEHSKTILDYFAGSGTTGHAVINLNREDNGKRKYILVEMGEYFDTVLKPRIQKVIYSDEWKNGKPQNNKNNKNGTKNGISQLFKYFKIESYEDTLNNLEFAKQTKDQQDVFEKNKKLKEDYILNYSLDYESQKSLLNIDTFKTPFDYKLKIATSSVGETKDTNIDLIETFNYLLGIIVKKIDFNNSAVAVKDISSDLHKNQQGDMSPCHKRDVNCCQFANNNQGFLTITGQNLKDEKILIIWRDNKTNDELNQFVQQSEQNKLFILDDFDIVYVNGDSNLKNAVLIEQEFEKLMFGNNEQ
ncbi:MAG: site-specific DNA-methyltransferase [Gammaproteobacteria bacterium]|nr:MAG: site-specific DNA-methyltransferase [Gammaproteobacteria bacterium]